MRCLVKIAAHRPSFYDYDSASRSSPSLLPPRTDSGKSEHGLASTENERRTVTNTRRYHRLLLNLGIPGS